MSVRRNLLYLTFAVAVILWVSMGFPGWVYLTIAIAGALLAVGLFGPVWICSIHEASRAGDDHPCAVSFRRAAVRFSRPSVSTELWIYPGVEPQVSVLSSLAVKPRILMSQGLLGVIEEAELRELLVLAQEDLNSGPIFRRTFWSALVSICIAASPESWLRTVFYPKMRLTDLQGRRLAVLDALLFLALFPILDFLRVQSERYAWRPKSLPVRIPQTVVWGEPLIPGIEALHLFRPSRTRARIQES